MRRAREHVGTTTNEATKSEGILEIVAQAEGFEPPTNRFEAEYSIQLSYACTEEPKYFIPLITKELCLSLSDARDNFRRL